MSSLLSSILSSMTFILLTLIVGMVFIDLLTLRMNSKSTTAVSKSPASKFDGITHVYHLGQDLPCGRINNQITAMLHAVDTIFDDNENNTQNKGIIAIHNRWGYPILKDLFWDNEVMNETEFKIKLESSVNVPFIVHESRINEIFDEGRNLTHVYLGSRNTYYYRMNEWKPRRLTPEIIQRRHNAVLSQWFNEIKVSKQNLIGHKKLKEHILNNKLSKNYIVIHLRWLENSCLTRVEHCIPMDNKSLIIDPENECHMKPSYIKSILRQHYGHDLGGLNKPIVIITDGQNPSRIKNLKKDPQLGARLIDVTELLGRKEADKIRQPYNDMMLAIMPDCELFIGTRASTFAEVIGMSRIAGPANARPESNYVHTACFNTTNHSEIKVCSDCLYLCPKAETRREKQDDLKYCGLETPFN